MFPENKPDLGFDQVVATVADICEAADSIYQAVRDGIQIRDAATLFTLAPRIENIKRNGHTAVQQFLDLDETETAQASVQLSQRLSQSQSVMLHHLDQAFTLVARTYKEVVDVKNLVNDWSRFGQAVAKSLQHNNTAVAL